MDADTAPLRGLTSTPIVGFLTIAVLAATSSPTAHQDMAAMIAGAEGAKRWQTHLEAVSLGSLHAATFHTLGGFNAESAVKVPGHDGSATAAVGPAGPQDGFTVNRTLKGDLLMTRAPVAEPKRTLPAAGQIWELKDIFSAREDADLPPVAFAAPSRGIAETLTAYSSFHRDGGIEAAGTMLAEARPAPRAAGAPERPVAPTLVAYAPAEGGVDAPFSAVMGGAPRIYPDAEAAVDPEAEGMVPRAKPGTASLFGWLRSRMAPAPQDHSWAATPLPKLVFEPAQQKCLAEGIYFEARGEPVEGQAAVAQVILNRVKAPAYPDTICGVVYQNKSWRNRCQFSFACDRVPDRIRNQKAWETAQRVAAEVTSGKTWNLEVGSSTHYHATYVKPRWARKMKRMDRIGRHIFYKTYRGGLS